MNKRLTIGTFRDMQIASYWQQVQSGFEALHKCLAEARWTEAAQVASDTEAALKRLGAALTDVIRP